MSQRTIVIGDVHGCLQELVELLEKLRYDPRERLIFVGDVLDRGPFPIETLRLVRSLRAECVLGNHEEKHVRYARHEDKRRTAETEGQVYRNPMSFDEERLAQFRKLNEADLDWLRALPLYIELSLGGKPWLVTHAGCIPGLPLAEWETNLGKVVRVRHIDPTGKMVPSFPKPPQGARSWTEEWKGPQSVIYGHNAQSKSEPRIDEPAPGIWCYGIDTGCVFGGHLTAAVFEEGNSLPSFVQVRAHSAYAQWFNTP